MFIARERFIQDRLSSVWSCLLKLTAGLCLALGGPLAPERKTISETTSSTPSGLKCAGKACLNGCNQCVCVFSGDCALMQWKKREPGKCPLTEPFCLAPCGDCTGKHGISVSLLLWNLFLRGNIFFSHCKRNLIFWDLLFMDLNILSWQKHVLLTLCRDCTFEGTRPSSLLRRCQLSSVELRGFQPWTEKEHGCCSLWKVQRAVVLAILCSLLICHSSHSPGERNTSLSVNWIAIRNS